MPWQPIAPPTYFSPLPQIQNPTLPPPDPGTQMNQLAMGNAQRQLLAQQAQAVQTENQISQVRAQQAQQDFEDMQTFRSFYRQANGDLGQALTDSVNAGVGPNVIMPIRQAVQQYQMGQANLTEKQQEVQNLKLDGLHRLLLPVQAIKDPVAQEQAFNKAMPQAAALGYITTADIAQHPYTGPDDLDKYVQGLATLKSILADAEQRKAAAEAGKANAETAGIARGQAAQELQAITDLQTGVPNVQDFAGWAKKYPDLAPANGAPPSAQWVKGFVRSTVPPKEQPEYDINTARSQAARAFGSNPQLADQLVDAVVPVGQNNSAGENARGHALVRAALASGQGPEGVVRVLSQLSQEQAGIEKEIDPRLIAARVQQQVQAQRELETLTPDEAKLAKSIANYQVAPLTSFAMARPQGRAIMSAATAINPDYHSEYYDNFRKTELDATTGKIGTAANALNTMMGHLSVLKQASDALSTGNLLILNRIGNSFGVQVGANPVTAYTTIVHRLGPEVTKAYLAAGGTQGERGTNEEDFSPNLSPAQRNANIGVSAQLAQSKIKALQDQYQRGTYGRGQQRLITADAENARQRLTGLSPVAAATAVTVTDPQGGVHSFRSQQDADNFKKLAGMQ